VILIFLSLFIHIGTTSPEHSVSPSDCIFNVNGEVWQHGAI